MLFQINHHSGVPIYRQVMDQIRGMIITNHLEAGDQLESVRELSARLKVNPMTISKAYSLLEAEGVVERKRGVGVFVANLKSTKQRQIKNGMLNDIIEKAASVSVQLKIDEEQAIELFKKLYRQHKNNNERQK